LTGVALCDIDDVDRGLAELDAALELGLGVVQLPARAPGGRAPGIRTPTSAIRIAAVMTVAERTRTGRDRPARPSRSGVLAGRTRPSVIDRTVMRSP